MEPIKFEVSVSVNVDLSQGTKDFVSQIVEKKIEAAREANSSMKESLEPIKAVLGMFQPGCGPAAVDVAPHIPNAVESLVQNAAEAGKAAAEAAATAVKAAEAAKAAKAEEQKPAKAVTIEEVRAALASKVNDHRDSIKAKLDELGAPSVTKLDPSKYEEMYNFLNSL